MNPWPVWLAFLAYVAVIFRGRCLFCVVAAVTEAEALVGWDGVGGIEAWIAAQPWQAMPDGWRVQGSL